MDKRSILFCSLLALGSAAHAGGFYILGSVGQSHTDLRDVTKSDLDSQFSSAAQGLGYSLASSKLEKTDTGYKLQVGYQFAPNFALEGGYVNLGKTEYKFSISNGSAQSSGNLSYKSKGWNVDGLLILPVNAGVSLFGKLGVIRAQTTFSGTGLDSTTVTKTAPLFGVGVAWNFWRGMSVRAEWERFFDLGDQNQIGSKLNVDLYSAGLSYQF